MPSADNLQQLKEQLEELELKLVRLEQENKHLRQREEVMRQNEAKLLEVQRMAAISSWKVQSLSGKLECSREALALFGLDSDFGLSVEKLFELIHPEDRPEFQRRYEDSLNSETPFEIKHRIVLPDGTERIVNHYCKTFLATNGMPLKTMGLMQDVTEIKTTEARLREAMAKAEAASKVKSDFLANMSHEIRTPLNAVINFSRLLHETDLNVIQNNYATKVEAAGRAVLGVINDILDFSKLDARRMELYEVSFNLDELVDNIMGIVSVCHENGKLGLRYQIQPAVPRKLFGDTLRLGQVLTNLLGNAVKFTESGEVLLTVEQVGKDGKREEKDQVNLRFAVRDTGIGIAPADQARLFQPFCQADASTTRRFGGAGLGLAISQRLVELMGGKIQVDSIPGEGSTFSFVIPLRMEAKGIREALLEKTRPSRRGLLNEDLKSRLEAVQDARILLVEDHLINQKVAKALLAKASVQVTVASSGEQALQQMETQDFDLVLMDIQMPGMDGLETTRHIRNNPRFRENPPIVAMTANVLLEDREKSLAAGMQDHLGKPIDPQTLYEALIAWIPPRTHWATPQGGGAV